MHKKRIGIIGCGYWGSNLIRDFNDHSDVEIILACDSDTERLNDIKALYPKVRVTEKFEDITRNKEIDAVVVATPVFTHFPIVLDALKHKKDVLCEKPLTVKSKESRELINIARENKCILMVGHVFLFNPGILKLKEIIRSGSHGNKFFYMHSQRTNLGPIREDVNVVYDLASHDISIFNFLFESTPKVLSVSGISYLQNDLEDMAFITLEYLPKIIVQIYVSWLYSPKVRKISLIGDKTIITWDDLSLDTSLETNSLLLSLSDTFKNYSKLQHLEKEIKKEFTVVKKAESLKTEIDYFVKCIQNRQTPICDGENGYMVVKVLEEINETISLQRKTKSLV